MSDWSKFLGIPLWFWLFVLPTLISLVCLFLQNKLEKIFNPIWKILDKVYYYSGIIAATSMCLILFIIIAQMITRWTGIIFEGSTTFFFDLLIFSILPIFTSIFSLSKKLLPTFLISPGSNHSLFLFLSKRLK